MEVDVSGWRFLGPEPSGRDRGKAWLAEGVDDDPSASWLWKPRLLTGSPKTRVAARNDVSEVAGSRIAAALGIPAAECHYAVRGEEKGVISRNVMPAGAELQNAVVYLTGVAGYLHRAPRVGPDGRPRGLTHLDKGYTLDAVEEVLEGVDAPRAGAEMTAFQAFTGFLVLDVLIANNDRHPGNWAILNWEEPDERPQLAPTFDHGSALGFGLTDERRENTDIARFVRRGRAKPFAGRPALDRLAQDALRRSGAYFWLERVQAVDDAVIEAAVDAPRGRLSRATATFITTLLQETRRRLR